MWWFRVAWQILLLSLLSFAGDCVVNQLQIPIPGPLVGLAALFAGLHFGWVKLAWVEDGADVLIRDLLLFFIPPAVGIMQYTELFGTLGARLIGGVVVSILILLWVICICTLLVMKARRKGWRRL